jgi:ATP-dependent protease ClpP protease subunit
MPKRNKLVYGPFAIQALANRQAEILIYGDIGASWDDQSITAANFVRDLQTLDAATIDVRINSYGGSVSDAIAIYNALTRHPATVNTHVDGVALSAASLIAMAGDTMAMAENALLMIHGPFAMAAGNAQTMREMADILDRYALAMAPSYAAKTGKPANEMLALLTDGADHWYTANEAVVAGFADQISEAVPVQAHFDLSRFRNAPAAVAAFSKGQTMEHNPPTAVANAAANTQQPPVATPQPPVATPQPTPAPTPPTPQPTPAPALAVVAAGRTVEHNREIRAAFSPFLARDPIRALYDDVMVDTAISVDAARSRLVTALGEGITPANPPGHAPRVDMGPNETDKFRDACAIAIVARAGFATAADRTTLSANPYRGHKLLDMARASLDRIGVSTRGMSQMEVVAAAFTQGTSDFPVLLENAMNKTLLGAYAVAPDTWSKFCMRGSVSDFRASNRYRTGSFGALEVVNELGEFHNKSIPDGEKAQITAATKGNIINLSRQAVINDDMGAFVGLAAMLGRAARRTVEIDVYALLALNSGSGPTMADGQFLFSAAHNNFNAAIGGPPSVTALETARIAMATQKDVGGNDYLDLRPAVGLFPMQFGGQARVINGALYDPSTPGVYELPNMVNGLLRDIVDSPRITTNDWYLFADPGVAPVIEVAFLDGNDAPYLELENGFDVDGARYKVRLDYGVGAIDYRGGYRNDGTP